MIFIKIDGNYLIVIYSQVCSDRTDDRQQVRSLKGYETEMLRRLLAIVDRQASASTFPSYFITDDSLNQNNLNHTHTPHPILLHLCYDSLLYNKYIGFNSKYILY